ncbi:MAG: orotidine 5'-phosphate decarboxylase [Phycisphaerae bacterium]|nr:MAG: orotidine 5'-phosphate decarboxylase [Phycisphaerae bacterium]
MAEGFADNLVRGIERCGTCACVGIDPVLERLPASLGASETADRMVSARVLERFSKGVIDAVADRVPVVKLNIAFFEPFRGAGIDAYYESVRHAHQRGLLVIGDIKRSDIGHSSASYAAAHLIGDGPTDDSIPDAVTISGYLGIDGVAPFIEAANTTGRGVFVLVHTSNASAKQLQHLPLERGGMVVEEVASLVHEWGQSSVGESGFSGIGAVAAPGSLEIAQGLRKLMPQGIFLVPGFGAQGRSVEQVAACFDDRGMGAIVNASRSVIYAHENAGDEVSAWQDSVAHACDEFVSALTAIHYNV